jgi:hypothetical protein
VKKAVRLSLDAELNASSYFKGVVSNWQRPMLITRLVCGSDDPKIVRRPFSKDAARYHRHQPVVPHSSLLSHLTPALDGLEARA